MAALSISVDFSGMSDFVIHRWDVSKDGPLTMETMVAKLKSQVCGEDLVVCPPLCCVIFICGMLEYAVLLWCFPG